MPSVNFQASGLSQLNDWCREGFDPFCTVVAFHADLRDAPVECVPWKGIPPIKGTPPCQQAL